MKTIIKKIGLMFLFLQSIYISNAGNISFAPLNINLKGLEASGDTTIAFGDFGSALISCDNQKTWKQIRIFDTGNIIGVCLEKSRIVAFSDIGDVSISADGGKSWNIKASLGDSLVYVISSPGGYFALSRMKIINLGNDFEVKEAIPWRFKKTWKYNSDIMYLRRSIVIFDDYLVAENDSAVLIRYDFDLEPIDSLFYTSLGLCDTCKSGYSLYADSEYLYTRTGNILYRSKDFKSMEKFFDFNQLVDSAYTQGSKMIGAKMYCFTRTHDYRYGPYINVFEIPQKDSAIWISTVNCSELPGSGGLSTGSLDVNDFIIENGLVTIAANSKFLASAAIGDTSTNRISDLTGIKSNTDFMPDFTGDSEVLYYTKEGLYLSADNGITFRRLPVDSVFFPKKNYFNFKFKFFDELSKTVYLGGYYPMNESKAYVMVSDDFGQSFEAKEMKGFSYNGLSVSISNIYKNKDCFVISESAYRNKTYNWTFTYDINFGLTTIFRDSNYIVDYVNSKDTNDFLMVYTDTNYYRGIKHTADKGLTWNSIGQYGFTTDTFWLDSGEYQVFMTSDFIDKKEIVLNGKTYWIIFSYKKADSVFAAEALDTETYKLSLIYSCKQTDIPGAAADCSNDTVYMAIGDTMFIFTDFAERQSWKHIVFPDNGKVINRKLKKTGDRLFAFYSDDKHEANLYWISYSKDSILSVTENNRTEEQTYLYIYPPYPVPARNIVRSLIFWDPAVNIDIDEIGVIDINGNKTEGRENLKLEKLTTYSGYLTWNCAGIAPGVYFIYIHHGNNYRILKVIVQQ